MQGYNVIVIYNKDFEKLLMCKRKKDPYIGLVNFVGGKIDNDEGSLESAYRELQEETGITNDDIRLYHLMDYKYYIDGIYLEVYMGRLNKEIEPYGNENDLLWVDLTEDFFDMDRFAGEGNIGHILINSNRFKDFL